MKNKKSICRTCKKELTNTDPQRRQRVVENRCIVGYTWIFTGECSTCSSDRIVTNRWKKRSNEDIIQVIEGNQHNICILQKILNKREADHGKNK